MRRHHIIRIAAALALAGAAAVPSITGQRSLSLASTLVPGSYQHIFVIMEENHSLDQIIGPSGSVVAAAAPNLNSYAKQYGLATNYFALFHASETNYVGLIGGNFYCIEDNAPYSGTATATISTVNPPCTAGTSYPATIPATRKPNNLASQLEAVGKTWKSYQQSLPSAGFTGTYWPSKNDTLYVSKHDPFLNFASLQSPTELQNIVPDTQLWNGQSSDLQTGQVPNFGFITPDECHDMHGGMKECPGSSKPLDSNDLKLISAGDTYAATIVNAIMGAPFWSQGNNAIVITFDENDDAHPYQPITNCCDAPIPGTANGGDAATIVITSKGPRGVQDPTAYNHYSLLQTIQDAFGLGCLQFTCDTKNVTPMARLFATS